MKKILISLSSAFFICLQFSMIPFFAMGEYPSVDNECDINNTQPSDIPDVINYTKVISEPETTVTSIYDDIKYTTEFKVSESSKFQNEDNVYSKTISVTETISFEESKDVLSKQSVSVIFYYDGVRAWIKNRHTDISRQEVSNDGSFLISGVTEIFRPKSECIISNIWTLYKRRDAGLHWKYYNNSHIDLICSKDGIISVNAKVSNS